MSAALGANGIGRGRWQPPRWAKPLLYGTAVLAGVGAMAWFSGPVRQPDRPEPRGAGWGAGKALQVSQQQQPAPAPAKAEPVRAELPSPPEPPASDPPPEVLPVSTWTAGVAPPPLRRDPSTRGPGASASGTQTGAASGAGTDGEPTEVSRRMQATALDAIRPMPSRGDDLFTLGSSTVFDCLTTEPLDSRMVGPITCTAQQDVWNVTADNILIKAGSDVHGMMDKGLAPGERRVWINWQYVRWPKPYRVKLPLSAIGADPMGQNGVPGDYERHLWERFESTLVASVLDFAVGTGQNALQSAATGGASNIFNFNSLGRGGSSLAQLAFERDRNIPPSIVRGPATIIKVKVMRDIDYGAILKNVVLR